MNKISLKVTDQDKAFANDERIEEEKIIKEAEKLAKIEQSDQINIGGTSPFNRKKTLMEERNDGKENALLKLGSMIEPKPTGKYKDKTHINEKPTNYQDMYEYQEGY